VVWVIVLFDAAMGAAAVLFARYGIEYGKQYADPLSNGLQVVGLAIQVGFGALIAIKRPRHPVGWLLLGSATVFLLDQGLVQNFVIYAVDIRQHAVPGGDLVGSLEQELWVLGVAPIAIFLPLLFPTGRLLSRRWRWVVALALAAMALTIFGNSFSPAPDSSSLIRGVHPVTLPQPFQTIADFAGGGIFALPICVLAAVISLALRYRRGSGEERHQLKWFIFAISVFLLGFAGSLVPSALGHPVAALQAISLLGLALVPVAAAIAVLKYRLYDIDVVISRTLVYGALAAFITAVYVGIVVGLGTLIGSGGQPNLLLSIVATAIVAVAFQPVRERLNKIANRIVYGRRATPYEILSQFSERVAETYAADEALPRMARVLAEGTGAERAQVWLRAGDLVRPAASWPEGGADKVGDEPVAVDGQDLPTLPGDLAVAVRHQEELLGALTVSKRSGESLTPIERKLLDDLAHQAGLVLKNVGLTAELLARLEDLRASRQRLVMAQDQERRKLERNLHDGAQQILVAIKVKLGLAATLTDTDPDRARELVGQLKTDTDEALETLRDLARGIYPPLLADQGLVAALSAQGRKATLPVHVEGEGIGRYPQDIEAAVYFCCLEALQNVQKYAGASSATITLSDAGSGLVFEVHDDGVGFDPATQKKGSGLQNMEDRLDALGGVVVLRSAPGRGTTITVSLPPAASADPALRAEAGAVVA
jgi:signal transduction histidine kinase